MTKGDERNKTQWELLIIADAYPGRDVKVTTVRLRAGKSYLERAIQHSLLELSVILQHQLKGTRRMQKQKSFDQEEMLVKLQE